MTGTVGVVTGGGVTTGGVSVGVVVTGVVTTGVVTTGVVTAGAVVVTVVPVAVDAPVFAPEEAEFAIVVVFTLVAPALVAPCADWEILNFLFMSRSNATLAS